MQYHTKINSPLVGLMDWQRPCHSDTVEERRLVACRILFLSMAVCCLCGCVHVYMVSVFVRACVCVCVWSKSHYCGTHINTCVWVPAHVANVPRTEHKAVLGEYTHSI